MSSTGVKALDQIDNLIYCLNDVINPGKTTNIPRKSFPNTSLSFQCRKYTTLFNHVRGHLQYQDFQYFSTCLLIKYPEKTVDFYIKNFGMVLLEKKEFKELGATFYFLISRSSSEEKYPSPSSEEAEELLWRYGGGVLQLRYDHDSNNDKDFKINNGNIEPHRGFGHIAFNTNDVYKACSILEKNGVTFKKKPNEGRMKGLAFAYDPNGYWVEIVKRSQKNTFNVEYNLSQTMIRIKNPEESLKFYCDLLGMRLITESYVFFLFLLYIMLMLFFLFVCCIYFIFQGILKKVNFRYIF